MYNLREYSLPSPPLVCLYSILKKILPCKNLSDCVKKEYLFLLELISQYLL